MARKQTLHLADGREVSWNVDPRAAARAAAWAARKLQTLESDLAGMAAYFPHWLLVGGVDGRPAYCDTCHALVAPMEGAMRCVVCRAERAVAGLLWVGQLPVAARTEAVFAARRDALRAAGFAEIHSQGIDLLLVPLRVIYPAEWPNVEPGVHYAPKWLDALGLPRANANYHLVGESRACLFGWGQWRAMAIHEVIQQRVVNHVVSLLKIAAGMAPERAFAGRVEH
jgi:hypothetical protein